MKSANTIDRHEKTILESMFEAYSWFHEKPSPVLPTLLTYDGCISDQHDVEVWLASEIHQPTRAYKIRGAYNYMSRLKTSDFTGVVTASAGNHAQGVAFCADQFGLQATIFMPRSTPAQKVNAVIKLGGPLTRTVITGDTYDESCEAAYVYAKQANEPLVHPFDEYDVIAGQGTLGLEIIERHPDVDAIICPVGGGGLISGVGLAAKASNPNIEVIGVEPAGAASMQFAFDNDKATEVPYQIDTFVDGAAVAKVGSITFEVSKKVVDQLVSVTNLEVKQAIVDLAEKSNHSMLAEPAGALAVAGLKKINHGFRKKKVVAIVSGGNISKDRYTSEILGYSN